MQALVDLVALVAVLSAARSGYRRGALLSLLHLGGIALAYVAAYQLSPVLGPWAESVFGIPHLAARLAAGAAAFFAVSIAVWLLTRWAVRRRRARIAEGRAPVALDSRLAGAALGLVVGLAVVTACCWGYEAVRLTAWGRRLPDISGSYTARVARAIAREGTYAVVRARGGSERRAAALARMLSSPDETLRELEALFAEPSLRGLLQSQAFLQDFLSGEKERLLANPDLQALLADEPVMERLSHFGLVPSDYRRPDFPDELCTELARLGGRVRALREDPETAATVRQLEEEGMLTWSRLLDLLRDKRFYGLIERVFAPDGSQPEDGGGRPGGDEP